VSRRARPAGGPGPFTSMAVDLRLEEGIDAAVAGVDTIIHCATAFRGDSQAARNLIAAAGRASVSHLVYISIVGVDQVPFSYYRAKLEVERLIQQSRLEWTILRTTQFHDLVLRLCKALARSPVMVVAAATSVQPIDAGEVAGRLVELFRGYRQGQHLAPERAVGQVTFEEFLAERIPAGRSGYAPTWRRR
jgi:uncharacterized protein YbjT (DUF2867 family)